MRRASQRRRAGFTLVEVAVTIVIVGIGLVLVLQGLNVAKVTAAQTRNQKLARELGLLTLGQIESGLMRDDIDTGMQGSYAEEGYPEFTWEVAVGADAFHDRPADGAFDSWAANTDAEKAAEEEEDEDAEEPFEKLKLRITFPKIREFQNEVILERWIPWKQVYGEAEAASGDSSKNTKASKAAAEGPAPAGSKP